jgi:hypothetical protein
VSLRAQRYREKAELCERMAAQAKTYEVRASFDEVARQWRDLARQVEQLEFDKPSQLK